MKLLVFVILRCDETVREMCEIKDMSSRINANELFTKGMGNIIWARAVVFIPLNCNNKYWVKYSLNGLDIKQQNRREITKNLPKYQCMYEIARDLCVADKVGKDYGKASVGSISKENYAKTQLMDYELELEP